MAMEHDLDSALAQAVRAVGSQSAFGRLISRAQPTINGWLKNDVQLPGEYVLRVEAETGISRHDLRPDLYPREAGDDHAPVDLEPTR